MRRTKPGFRGRTSGERTSSAASLPPAKELIAKFVASTNTAAVMAKDHAFYKTLINKLGLKSQ